MRRTRPRTNTTPEASRPPTLPTASPRPPRRPPGRRPVPALPIRDFAAGEPISLGALVRLDGRGGSHYFIGPRAGGTEIEAGGDPVLVITPQSPLGRQLMGRKQGDTLQLDLGGKRSEFRVSSVA